MRLADSDTGFIVPATTIVGLVRSGKFADRPNETAFIDAESKRRTTYAEFIARAEAVAAWFHANGAEPGDVVALQAPNSADWAIAFHGALRANLVVTPINMMNRVHEVEHQLRLSGAKFVIAGDLAMDAAGRGAVSAEIGMDRFVAMNQNGPAGSHRWDELVECDGAVPVFNRMPEDIAALPFSSGTSGPSKGVILTHRNLVATVVQNEAITNIEPGSALVAFLPLSHIYGLNVLLNQALYRGATTVMLHPFDLETLLSLIQEHRIDRLFVTPPVVAALAKSPLVDEFDTRSLRVIASGAAPLGAQIARQAADRLGCQVIQGYGLTETSATTHCVPDGRTDLPLESCGLPMPGIEYRVVAADGLDAPAGERGELFVRGPGVMRGYLEDAAATAGAFDAEGFFRTGDIVTIDDQGCLHIVDRAKDLIKYKGYQVSPAELESILLAHDQVEAAAVVPAVGDDGEEFPSAWVVKRGELAEAELMNYVADQVAPYKKVRKVTFVNALPCSPSGKILRRELKQRSR